MRRSLEMGSPTPDDAPDRPRSSFAFGAFLRTVAGFPPPDSRPSLHSACHVVHHGLRARKECAAHRRTAVRPHRRCRTPARARRPAPRHRADRRPPARRPMGIMVEAVPARRPRPGGERRRRRRRGGGGGGGGGGRRERSRPRSARLAGQALAGAMPTQRALPKQEGAEGHGGGRGMRIGGGAAEDPRSMSPARAPTRRPRARAAADALRQKQDFSRLDDGAAVTVTCTNPNCPAGGRMHAGCFGSSRRSS